MKVEGSLGVMIALLSGMGMEERGAVFREKMIL